MHHLGKGPLGAFALYVLRPTWIGSEPANDDARVAIVWSGLGPHSVPIHARRDGFIIFEFDKSPTLEGGTVPSDVPGGDTSISKAVSEADVLRTALAYKRFRYMNGFLAGLYSGWSTVQKTGISVQAPINPTNYFGAVVDRHRWKVYSDGETKVDYPVSRGLLKEDTVAHAVELMMRCKNVFGDQAIELLTLTYIACHQYSLHQFPSAHLIAWSVIEMQLNVMWSGLLKEMDIENGGHTRINKERRTRLEGGRDYTASVITQILSLQGKVDDGLLSQLDAARKKRNAFAHSLEPIEAGDAGKAIRTATDLMTKLADFTITSQLSTSFWL